MSLIGALDNYTWAAIIKRLNVADRYALRATCQQMRTIIDTLVPLGAALIDAIELRVITRHKLTRRMDDSHGEDFDWVPLWRTMIDDDRLVHVDGYRLIPEFARMYAIDQLRPYLVRRGQISRYDTRHIWQMLRQLEAANLLREGAREILLLDSGLNNVIIHGSYQNSSTAHIVWRYLAKRGISLQEYGTRNWIYYGDGRTVMAYQLRYDHMEARDTIDVNDVKYAPFIRKIMENVRDPLMRHDTTYNDVYRDARSLVALYHTSRAHPVIAHIIENIFVKNIESESMTTDHLSCIGSFLPQCLAQFGYCRFANRLYDMYPRLRTMSLYRNADQLRDFIRFAATGARREDNDLRDVLREMARIIYPDGAFPISRERHRELNFIALMSVFTDVAELTCERQTDRAWHKVLPLRQTMYALMEGIDDAEISHYENMIDTHWHYLGAKSRNTMLAMIRELRAKK